MKTKIVRTWILEQWLLQPSSDLPFSQLRGAWIILKAIEADPTADPPRLPELMEDGPFRWRWNGSREIADI